MKTICVLLLLFVSVYASADQRAVTDEGKVVVLSPAGTWKYADDENVPQVEPTINPGRFEKDETSSFPVKSTTNDSVFWIDPKEWSFQKGKSDTAIEYSFQKKDSDLYGMAISEAIPIELASLADIALQNAKNAAPDARIVKKEFRMVNGVKVMYMEITGTASGVHFKYLGYYFSDPSGTTQYIAYTGESLVDRYQDDIAKFLNGFSVRK